MQITRNILFEFLIFLALSGLAYLLKEYFGVGIEFKDATILLVGALLISVFITLLFFNGLEKNEQKRIMFTFSAIGLKFLLFLALLGIYALVAKSLTIEFIITFFVVYLAFTIYLLTSFIKVLKTKKKNF